MRKRTIWSSEIGNIEDWREGYEEFCEINGIVASQDESDIYKWATDTNWSYLDDEKVNLDKTIDTEIIVICEISRWDGKFSCVSGLGYNISNILDIVSCDGEFEVFGIGGNIYGTVGHHDGYNCYTFRKMKKGVSEEDAEEFRHIIRRGYYDENDIERYTDSIYDDVADIYGWEI